MSLQGKEPASDAPERQSPAAQGVCIPYDHIWTTFEFNLESLWETSYNPPTTFPMLFSRSGSLRTVCRSLHPALHISAWSLISISVGQKRYSWDMAIIWSNLRKICRVPRKLTGLRGNPMPNISGQTTTSRKQTAWQDSWPFPDPILMYMVARWNMNYARGPRKILWAFSDPLESVSNRAQTGNISS